MKTAREMYDIACEIDKKAKEEAKESVNNILLSIESKIIESIKKDNGMTLQYSMDTSGWTHRMNEEIVQHLVGLGYVLSASGGMGESMVLSRLTISWEPKDYNTTTGNNLFTGR